MNRFFIPMIFVSLFLLLVSCSNDSPQDKSDIDKVPSQTSIKFTHNKQSFQIIPLYEEVLDYTALVKDNPSLNTKKEYFEKVVKPFQQIASEKNIDIKSKYFSYFVPSNDIQQLEENTTQLLQHQEMINKYIKESLLSSAQLLSGSNKTIFVMPFNPENTVSIQEMEGVAAWTLSKDVILVQMVPSFKEMALKYIISHEYHHTIAMESSEETGYDLLNPIVLEGKADSFATMVYPEHNVPWIEPLSNESEKIVLDEIRENNDSFNVNIYNGLFEGDSAKGISPWSNYKMGYKITQSFLKNNPDVSIDEWTKLDANQILQGSEYRNLLK